MVPLLPCRHVREGNDVVHWCDDSPPLLCIKAEEEVDKPGGLGEMPYIAPSRVPPHVDEGRCEIDGAAPARRRHWSWRRRARTNAGGRNRCALAGSCRRCSCGAKRRGLQRRHPGSHERLGLCLLENVVHGVFELSLRLLPLLSCLRPLPAAVYELCELVDALLLGALIVLRPWGTSAAASRGFVISEADDPLQGHGGRGVQGVAVQRVGAADQAQHLDADPPAASDELLPLVLRIFDDVRDDLPDAAAQVDAHELPLLGVQVHADRP
mmetsp:Transcript_63155/g.142026  ORF Transcript_63155/g.142026 Transcript_63155/m.142026 type:complete len:268 (+) Transcript_63155:459-1262(+)